MMKILLIFSFLVLTTIGYSQNASDRKNIAWNNFNQGLNQARTSGKKILIDVYTDWCTWCKKMDAVTYSDGIIQDYLQKNYIIVKLNAEGDEKVNYAGQTLSAAEFAKGMGVTGYPATLFLKSNGDPITVLPGYSEPKMFIHVLSFIGENHFEKEKFSDYLDKKGVKH
ncbi:MAG: DUF255 domain-containing protein [Bacteroidota bacterium]|nr:DUF255 domain-containing protein [Bacteroidota bacterium]